jgi:dienelactone hydrolase
MVKIAALLFFTIGLAPLRLVSQATAQTDLDLPRPNGCHPVGTQKIVLKDTHRSRDLLVTMWYPAADGKSTPAPYMDKRTADAVAEEWKLQPGFEGNVRTHLSLQAPVAVGTTFPVVFLEHGSGVVPAVYTVLAEGLASNGFIVVATNHPPDSLIAVYPDGHEVKSAPYWPVDADRRTQGIAIGKFADDVLVADVRFVLDQLEQMNGHDAFWRRHMDLSKVGIVGHSMGGTTAALAAKEERRVLAGVNLDGSTFPGMNGDVRPVELHKPFLFIATEEHASDPGSRAREYAGSESDSYYVVVPGADHMNFSDTRLLSSRFSRERQPDHNGFERALLTIDSTRGLVEEFLAKYLKGVRAPHLDVNVRVEKK